MKKEIEEGIDLKPIGDRVLVRPITDPEITRMGVLIPDVAKKEKPLKGIVLAVGQDALDYEIGSTIYYGKYAGQAIKVFDEWCMMFNGDEILAKGD